jgi:UDP-N-acetylglucosamine 3-dehydrogenase
MDTLNAAVIGVGRMGKHHARLYDQIPDVDLAAVVDTNRTQLEKIGRRYKCRAYMGLQQLLDDERVEIDLASVATPTSLHFTQADMLIHERISVLVEKPLARSACLASALLTQAEHFDVTLAVGHVERCNPAVRAVKREIEAGAIGEVYRVSTRRCGPSPERIRDVGVTIDLAVHDLDIMTYLIGEEPIRYQAMMQRRSHGDREDSVDALLRFPSGAVGVLECDWLAAAKVRTLSVVGSKGTIEADYIKQTAWVSSHPGEWRKINLVRDEPLLIEITEFINAVCGKGQPAASGHDGLLALQMAAGVMEAGNKEEHGPVSQ